MTWDPQNEVDAYARAVAHGRSTMRDTVKSIFTFPRVGSRLHSNGGPIRRLQENQMPKMKETRRSLLRWATDHRAQVLESVATNPRATLDAIRIDCAEADPEFTDAKVAAMVWWLRREGLINRDETGIHVLTKAGLEWLTTGRFDRALPEYAERPAARKPRGKKGG